VSLYQRDYWHPLHGDVLPDGLALLLFDSAVNQGPTTAIKLLQKALKVNVDRIIGPQTEHAALAAMPRILTDFAAERALRYEFNRNEATFGRGWYRRLLTLHSIAVRWHP
jgi:lysozyme family protein